MLRVLLKKQIEEIFRGYFYNRKTNTVRSKRNRIMLFVLFALLMIVGLGGTFTAVALGVCFGLAAANMGWLYFVLMSGIAIALGVFGSVINTYSSLYLPKDNDLLLSMPIPVKIIIISRLLNVYLLGVLFSGVVMLPALIVYWAIAGATVSNVICGLILFFIVTVLVLILSCLLGWVVAKISLKLKNKSFIVVIIALTCIGAYYFLYFKLQEWIKILVANAMVYGTNIKDSAYVLYVFGSIGEGSWAAAAIFTAAVLIFLALIILLLSRGFLKIATSAQNIVKNRYQEKRKKQKSVFYALLSKELVRFTSSPNYMLNNGLGTLLIPVFGIFMLIKGRDIISALGIAFNGRTDYAVLLICAVLMLVSTMNDMAAPSISLEGKNIWILQSMPIDYKTVLKAKAAMQIILTMIPVIFAAICMAIILDISALEKIMSSVLVLIFTIFLALFGSLLGVKHPVMNWTTEIIPIKQSAAVTVTLFGGWGFTALFAVPYFFIGQFIGLLPYLIIWTVIYSVLSVLLYRQLITKGAEAFSEL